jgi:hypothetical protein
MPNLKAIRDQIQSVKNTKKITEAMRLVAAGKSASTPKNKFSVPVLLPMPSLRYSIISKVV